jgi:hypothetical protein
MDQINVPNISPKQLKTEKNTFINVHKLDLQNIRIKSKMCPAFNKVLNGGYL